MPELPEVETIRRQLEKKIIGKAIKKKEITNVKRRGKFLIINFKGGSSFLIHLKLTGQVIFKGERNSYTRKIFRFDDGDWLTFNDARKFAFVKEIKNKKNLEKILNPLGPEALEISYQEFKKGLKKRSNVKIKPLLMDQKFLAGIGNIYSDEILYRAKVNPLKKAKELKDKEIKLIFKQIKKVLKEAIQKRGSSVEYYLDAFGEKGVFEKFHKVYQKEGEKCERCGAVIKKIKLNGRGCRFCPNCQK